MSDSDKKVKSYRTKVLTVFSQKGGVQKTTTCVNICQIMSEVYKKNVLLVDMDAQGTATLCCNIPNWDDSIPNLGNLIAPYATDGYIPEIDEILTCVQRGKYKKNVKKEHSLQWELKEFEYPFDVLPVCGTSLSIGELAIHNPENFIYKHPQFSFFMLKIIIDRIVKECDYDYIVIDANPSLSCFAINSLMAADFLIVPTTMTVESISGINSVLRRLKELNLFIPNFDVLGILYQKYDGGRTLDRSILEETNFKEFNTKIPDVSGRVSKSINEGLIPSMRQDKQYRTFREAYINLCQEIQDKIAEYEKKHGPIQRKNLF